MRCMQTRLGAAATVYCRGLFEGQISVTIVTSCGISSQSEFVQEYKKGVRLTDEEPHIS